MKHRFSELDALRGIAAVSVVLFHFTLSKPEAEYGFKYGVTGVDLFFIISGFVIIMTLSKVATWKEFAINRVARLYPCYWTCVTFTVALMLAVKVLGINTTATNPAPATPPHYATMATAATVQQAPAIAAQANHAPESTPHTAPVKKAGFGSRGAIEYLANMTMV